MLGIYSLQGRSAFDWIVALLLAACLPSIRAAESAQPAPIDRAVSPLNRPCVLMSNGNVVFGSARQIGDIVVISQGEGNAIRVKYQDVACWADSLAQLHRYRVDHRDSNNPNARLDDVAWCLKYDLLDQASIELEPVFNNRLWMSYPSIERRSTSLRKQIEQQRKLANSTKRENPQPISTAAWNSASHQKTTKLETVGFSQSIADPKVEDKEVDIDRNVLLDFTRNIQPLLINRCGRCHSNDHHSGWSLHMPLGRTRLSSTSTRSNLRSTAKFIELQQSEDDRLLQMATQPHGGLQQAPIASSENLALGNLIAWVQRYRQALTNQADRQSSLTEELAVDSKAFKMDEIPLDPNEHTNQVDGKELQMNESIETEEAMKSKPIARLPSIEDPFDPERFNRQHHGAQ